MQKPATLRAALITADPQLGRDPERLNMWVEEGRIRSPMVVSRGFIWEYRLNITLIDCTVHPSVLFLAINDWCRTNQPDLLTALPNAGYTFDADILDLQTVDLHITLKLSEQVALVTGAGGEVSLQHLAEPDMSWLTGDDPLTTPPVALTAITPVPGPPPA